MLETFGFMLMCVGVIAVGTFLGNLLTYKVIDN